ncbi:hypothetical protein AB668_00815 [Mycoplasma sp. HU2014]|nr:hypothetical protein AB668_00815 [Mycoplasma sp. HU2014]
MLIFQKCVHIYTANVLIIKKKNIENFWNIRQHLFLEQNVSILKYISDENKKTFVRKMNEIKFKFINTKEKGIVSFIEKNELYLINLSNAKRVYETLHSVRVEYENILSLILKSKKMKKTKEFII